MSGISQLAAMHFEMSSICGMQRDTGICVDFYPCLQQL